jgi:DNA replication protein DnaC
MLIQPTIENMKSMKLLGMVKSLEAQMQMQGSQELTFEERLGLLVDSEMAHRDSKRLQDRLRNAKLRLVACIENLDLKASRGLDRSVMTTLATSDWAKKKRNLTITGPCGSGKTYVSCALAEKACRDGFSVIYVRACKLFDDLALARAVGNYAKILLPIVRRDVLIIDDFALAPLTDEQRRDLLEIVEERYDQRSTVIASQVPVDKWHDVIGDPTIADAILDRLVHNAYKLSLKAKVSLRKGQFPDIDQNIEF